MVTTTGARELGIKDRVKIAVRHTLRTKNRCSSIISRLPTEAEQRALIFTDLYSQPAKYLPPHPTSMAL